MGGADSAGGYVDAGEWVMSRNRRVLQWTVGGALAGLLLLGCSGDGDAEGEGVDDAAATTTTLIATTTTTIAPPGEAQLQAVVADAWSAIWVRDWDALIDVYAVPCRDDLTPEDFDATLGLGVEALEGGGIDPTGTRVKVQVNELVVGESAQVVSFLTFPGFEDEEEDDTGDWIVEDGTWRRTDCADVLGAGTPPEAEEGQVLGSPDQPVALGGMFDFEGWRAGVLDVEDAGPFLADFSEAAPEGETFLMIVTEMQYLGTEFAEPDPFLVRAKGSADYESFGNGCALDPAALAAQGIVVITSAMPGQTLVAASCVSVPSDEISSMQIVLENAFAIADREIHYSVDGVEAEPLPAISLPEVDPAAGATAFGEVVSFGEEFTGTVVSLHDGVAEGLVSDFGGSPPDGSTYAVVVWEGTYVGSEPGAADPFVAVGLGSGAYEFLSSPCTLDLTALAAAHSVDDPVELAPQTTFRGATCWTVPLDEFDSVVVQLDNVFDFEVEPVRFVR